MRVSQTCRNGGKLTFSTLAYHQSDTSWWHYGSNFWWLLIIHQLPPEIAISSHFSTITQQYTNVSLKTLVICVKLQSDWERRWISCVVLMFHLKCQFLAFTYCCYLCGNLTLNIIFSAIVLCNFSKFLLSVRCYHNVPDGHYCSPNCCSVIWHLYPISHEAWASTILWYLQCILNYNCPLPCPCFCRAQCDY